MSNSKEVIIFPYINIDKIIKMGDFEIHPIETYNFNNDLDENEIKFLKEFTLSFRESLFKEGEIPKQVDGIGILKYKGSILRTNQNSSDINEKVKILFLLLKLHISKDYFNPWMNTIDVKSFEYHGYNLSNSYTNKFGHIGKSKTLHSSVPENIKGLKDVTLLPLDKTSSKIPITFSMFGGSENILGINSDCFDLSEIFTIIESNKQYYRTIYKISNVYYALEGQDNTYLYYSIIPSLIEILLGSPKDKKLSAVKLGIKLDRILIQNNEIIKTRCCGKNMNLGLIARTISHIYDIRNSFLHQGKESKAKTIILFKGLKVNLYDIFQLIMKYKIINSFIEKGIINNNFSKLTFEGNLLINGNIKIYQNTEKLHMDEELNGLLEKAKSDKELKDGLYKE